LKKKKKSGGNKTLTKCSFGVPEGKGVSKVQKRKGRPS